MWRESVDMMNLRQSVTVSYLRMEATGAMKNASIGKQPRRQSFLLV